MSTSNPPEEPHIPLQRFLVREGVVESEASQEVVDNYAADFQGLRHFGQRVGEALDLGTPWTVSLREAQFTLNYAQIESNLGAGALIGQRESMASLLTEVSQMEEEEPTA